MASQWDATFCCNNIGLSLSNTTPIDDPSEKYCTIMGFRSLMPYDLQSQSKELENVGIHKPCPSLWVHFPCLPHPLPHALSFFLQNLLQIHDLFKSNKTGIVDEIITKALALVVNALISHPLIEVTQQSNNRALKSTLFPLDLFLEQLFTTENIMVPLSQL